MVAVKVKAAVVRAPGKPWEITELDVDEPKEHEVLIRFMASGMCHSDEHARAGTGLGGRYPKVGGHEGAGIVEAVGPSVSRVKVGDHVVCSFIPVCGACRYCSTGHQNLCNAGLNAMVGCMADGTFRFHENGGDLGGVCVLGTFAQAATVSEYSCVKIDDDIPFEVACLVGCGVTTGWGSSVYAARVRAGETVVVFGIGGVGINAVQGARFAGAKHLVAVDPVPFKLESARALGATFATSNVDEAREHVRDITRGEMADHAVITVGVLDAQVVREAVSMVGKAGSVVVTAMGGAPGEENIRLSGASMVSYQVQVQAALFGASNPLYDIPRLLGLYRSGDLKLDELITRRYRLEEVNQGYEDMLEGRNVRGVIVHEH